MRRFILTGAPGSGETALIRKLELEGYGVVEEMATDLIALKQGGGVDGGQNGCNQESNWGPVEISGNYRDGTCLDRNWFAVVLPALLAARPFATWFAFEAGLGGTAGSGFRATA